MCGTKTDQKITFHNKSIYTKCTVSTPGLVESIKFAVLLDYKYCVVVRTSDTRKTRGPVRYTREGSTNVSQDTVNVIFHPN